MQECVWSGEAAAPSARVALTLNPTMQRLQKKKCVCHEVPHAESTTTHASQRHTVATTWPRHGQRRKTRQRRAERVTPQHGHRLTMQVCGMLAGLAGRNTHQLCIRRVVESCAQGAGGVQLALACSSSSRRQFRHRSTVHASANMKPPREKDEHEVRASQDSGTGRRAIHTSNRAPPVHTYIRIKTFEP